MDNVLSVAIVERLQDLLENACGNFFREVFLLNDTVKEFSTCAKPIGSKKEQCIKLTQRQRDWNLD